MREAIERGGRKVWDYWGDLSAIPRLDDPFSFQTSVTVQGSNTETKATYVVKIHAHVCIPFKCYSCFTQIHTYTHTHTHTRIQEYIYIYIYINLKN